MSAPDIPYTNNTTPAAPRTSTSTSTRTSNARNTLAVGHYEFIGTKYPPPAKSGTESTSYSLPASYVLPVIDENSELLDDNEFNMLRIVINRIKVDPKFANPF
jgi:hypothetical protein